MARHVRSETAAIQSLTIQSLAIQSLTIQSLAIQSLTIQSLAIQSPTIPPHFSALILSLSKDEAAR